MFIKEDTKAEIKWIFDAGKYRGSPVYQYNKIIFTLCGKDIKVEFIPIKFKGSKLKKKVGYIRNYRQKTALDTIRKYNGDLGRHFDDGILTIYHDLGLPLGYTEPILKEV